MPGGILELSEGIEAGVKREVLEETGLIVKPTHLTGVYKNLERGVVALVFSCEILSGEAVPTDESKEVRWMKTAEVKEKMAPAFAVRMLDVLADDVQIRLHDGINLLSQTD